MHVTVKEWLKSVLNYRSYPKKLGIRFLDHPVVFFYAESAVTSNKPTYRQHSCRTWRSHSIVLYIFTKSTGWPQK